MGMNIKNINRQENIYPKISKKFSAAIIGLAILGPVNASAFDILAEDEPKATFSIDDAAVPSRTTRKEIDDKLSNLQTGLGYKLTLITTRKLEFDPDAFTFSDKVFNKWHKSDGGDKSGLLLMVTSNKDGALVGGNSLLTALGDELIDSIIGDNIPYYTEEERYNEAVTSSITRIVDVLNGKNDPGAPVRNSNSKTRTYKTREETERVKPVTGTIVLTLLAIAFVVPMLQFYGYVSKD